MKPKTKQQLLVKALSDKLPELTSFQENWAFKNCLMHWAYRTKTNTSCMDCGHIWIGSQDNKTCNCPKCGVRLTIVDTRKKKVYQRGFLGLVTVCNGFQLNRFFEIHSHHKAGKAVHHFLWEVVQQWMQPEGKHQVIARNRGSMGSYADNFHGYLEIRQPNTLSYKYNIYPVAILPGAKCLPIYRRNGINGKIDIGIGPYDLFTAIIADQTAETLLKSKQRDLLHARCSDRKNSVSKYWPSIKICIRSGYIVKDAIIWLDYMALLDYFKKDLRNAKYVCPVNLRLAHKALVAKKAEIDNHERYSRLLKQEGIDPANFKKLPAARLAAEYNKIVALKNKAQLEQDEIDYIKEKKIFFGLTFSANKLTVKVLESIQEFAEEGDQHGHCVFTNKYFTKKDSLILKALVGGVPMETIEVSISRMKVIQSRGKDNKITAYHDQIIDLLNKNIHLIKKRAKEAKADNEMEMCA